MPARFGPIVAPPIVAPPIVAPPIVAPPIVAPPIVAPPIVAPPSGANTGQRLSDPDGTLSAMDTRAAPDEPLLRAVDAVTLSVADLDAGIAFYRDRLGHRLRWRNDAIGQAALACPESATEIVLSTSLPAEANWLVRDATRAAEIVQGGGGRVVQPAVDIPVGRVAVVEDPFGNRLVLVDLSKGRYRTDGDGAVIGVTQEGATQETDRAGPDQD